MREAREEMLQSLNESNLEKMRKASKGAKQTLKMKDGSIGMDSFTASAIMQIYDKVNDKNKKTMENLLKDGKKADIVKLMKFAMSKVNAEYVPEGAAADARRAMRGDPDMRQRAFSKDDSATDDERKAASKNIMMQMRKAVSLRSFDVEFADGKKVKVPQKMGQAVINKYNSFRRPAEKEKFQAKISKSYRDMLKALKESIDEAGYVKGKDPMPAGKELAKLMKKKRKGKKESTLERMNKKIQENKNG